MRPRAPGAAARRSARRRGRVYVRTSRQDNAVLLARKLSG